jgi:hypothetical protein
MPRGNKPSPARQFAALNDCQRGYHHWHDTFTPGVSLCQICGKKGYCPTCFPGPPPDGACVRLCKQHRSDAAQPVHVGFSQLPETAANCTVGRHRWVHTTATGMSQCAICGTVGYCFACYPHAPADAISAPCASHRAQGKEAQA